MTKKRAPRDPWSALLREWLDQHEELLRSELTTRRRPPPVQSRLVENAATAPDPLDRRDALFTALHHTVLARQRLLRLPDEAAELAYDVIMVHSLLARPSLVLAGKVERQHQAAGKASARKKHLAAWAVRAAFEDLKQKNPDLSNKAVARRYLQRTDPAWTTTEDADRERKANNLLKRIANVKKNPRR